MSITDEQKVALEAALDESRVKKLDTGGHAADYLETYDIIDTANRIFGFDGWSFEVIEVTQVHAATRDGEGTGAFFMARGRLTIGGVTREDIGTNDISYRRSDGSASPDAFETSAKGAVSDCLKRCFRTFGNQFGNSLKDKERNRPQRQQRPSSGGVAQRQERRSPEPRVEGSSPSAPAKNDNGTKFAELVKESKLSGKAILEIAGVESIPEIADWDALRAKVGQFVKGEPVSA